MSDASDHDALQEVLTAMRATYAAKLPAKADELAAVAEGEMPELVRALHALRGTAGSHGFSEIAERAGAIEHALVSGETRSSQENALAALTEAMRLAADELTGAD